MIKVLFINYSYGIGSTGRLITELEEKMDKDIYKVLVACKKTNKLKSGVYLIGNKISHMVAGLYSRISGLQGYGCVLQTKKLVKWIDQEQPDIIHLHNLHGNYINMRILFDFLKEYRGKIVWTLHDCWSFTGNCSYYELSQCKKWMNGQECIKCPNIKKYPPSWFFDRSHKMFKDKSKWYDGVKERIMFVTVSEWLNKEVKKSILKNERVETIYNWVDRAVFKQGDEDEIKEIRKRFSKEVLLFAAASDWTADKGLNYIYKLAEKLDDSIGIIIAGKCRNKKNYSNIYFVGEKNKKEMALYYNCADIYINLSIEETFGLTSAEALSCGKPVIGMNSSANPEVIGECGICLEKFTPELVVKEIKNIIENPDLFSQEKCQNWTEQMFTTKIGCNKYLQLYERILER